MPYKVLIPLDGSRLAESSLAYLRPLMQIEGLEVTLLGVVEVLPNEPRSQIEDVWRRQENLLSSYLRDIITDLQKHLHLDASARVRYGNPASEILDEADEGPPDLILMSTRGRSGLTRWRLGSVADKVIRSARCNVMAIGPSATWHGAWLSVGMNPFERLLVPLDGSSLAENALAVARFYAGHYGSNLHLVRVVPMANIGSQLATDGFVLPAAIEADVRESRSYLERFAEEARGAGADVTIEVLLGPTAERLSDYVDENRIDLVVMTSHGRGGLSRSALGSTADRLLGASAPVLLVRLSSDAAG